MYLWVDGPSISWKFVGLSNLEAIEGFIRHLVNILRKVEVTRLAVFWDTARSPARKALFPEYKAGRNEKKKPEDFSKAHKQMDTMRDTVFPSLGVPQVYLPEAEADDLIYAALQEFKAPTMVLTADKDFLQLVSNRTSVLLDRPQAPLIITPRNFIEHIHCRSPKQFLLMRMLIGDKSDHIPGVGGIGEARVKKILAKCGSLQELMDKREKYREDEDFELVFREAAMANLLRNWKLMDLSQGDGNKEQVRGWVKERVLRGTKALCTKDIRAAVGAYAYCQVAWAVPEFQDVIDRTEREP